MTADQILFSLSNALAPTSTLRAVLEYAEFVGTPACDCDLHHVDNPIRPEAILRRWVQAFFCALKTLM